MKRPLDAAAVAGAVAVGHDDRAARGVLLDALRVDRTRRQRPIAERRNNTNYTDGRGTTLQPLVALIPLEFGLDSCLLDLLALALGLLAGPRLPDGRRARARRRRVLEPHAATGRGLAGLMSASSEGRGGSSGGDGARPACHRASRCLPPTDRFPAVDLPPAPLIAPRRRCGPVCVQSSLQVQPRRQSATAHGDSSVIARTVAPGPRLWRRHPSTCVTIWRLS